MSHNLPWTDIAENMDNPETPITENFGIFDAISTSVYEANVSAGNVTVSALQSVARVIKITGATTAGRVVTLPAEKRVLILQSVSANNQDVTIKRGTTEVVLPFGEALIAMTDGTANGLETLSFGSSGPSLPLGGDTGQILTKQSSTDGDAAWQDPEGGISSDWVYYRITALTTATGAPCVSEIRLYDGADVEITPVAVTVLDSYSPPSYDAAKAWDDNNDTFWHAANASPGKWIKVQVAGGADVRKIEIYVKGQGYTQRMLNVTLEGSNDDSAWTVIHETYSLGYSSFDGGYHAFMPTPALSRLVPTGGLLGQSLVKASDTDNDVEWKFAAASNFVDVSQSSGSQTISWSFTKVTLATVNTDADANWDASNNWYTVPETGLYLILGKIRPNDSTTAGTTVGIGVHSSTADGPYFKWGKVGPAGSGVLRATIDYQRIASFNAGDQLRMFSYSDEGYTVNQAGLQIVKIS